MALGAGSATLKGLREKKKQNKIKFVVFGPWGWPNYPSSFFLFFFFFFFFFLEIF
jgi:hypothetical protein